MKKYMMAAGLICALITGAYAVKTIKLEDNVLKAQRFELVDHDGKSHGYLGLKGKSPELALSDETGAMRVRVGLSSEGAPQMHLLDKVGTTAMIIALSDTGIPVQMFAVKDERIARLSFGLKPDGSGTIIMLDKDGKSSWKAP